MKDSTNENILTEIYNELRKYRGSINALVLRSGFSRQTVMKVLKHREWKNKTIEYTAIQLIKEYKQKDKERLQNLRTKYNEEMQSIA